MEILEALEKYKIVAIARKIPRDKIVQTAEALYNGGVRMMEVTFDQKAADPIKDTAGAIAELCEKLGDKMYFGAGTVITPEQAEAAVKAGARYIISPNFNPEVVKKTLELGAVSMPGAMTPSEVLAAHDAGAQVVKLFPAGSLGLGYIKAIMAPISHVPLMATGGVNAANMREFLDLGMAGLGIGGNIVDSKLIAEGRFEELTEVARSYTKQI